MSATAEPEYVDILDPHGVVIGTMTRSEAEDANHVTQNVLMFIFNPAGAVWIQKRPVNKKHYPGLWDISTCGGLIAGETPAAAAAREQQEEMGFTCPLTHVESFMNIFPDEHGGTRRRLSHLYIGQSDQTPRSSAEVDEFRAVAPAQLRQQVLDQPQDYIPSFIVELDKAVAAFSSPSH